MITQVTKYMCTVETKNYPVTTIRPTINRYSSIRKKFSASEIANCLACYAIVTLHKTSGAKIRLTADNFKSVLLAYKNEQLEQQERNEMLAQVRKNSEALKQIKEEESTTETTTETTTTKKAPAKKVEETIVETEEVVEEKEDEVIVPSETESLEEVQSDPENPETADWSYIDGEEDEAE